MKIVVAKSYKKNQIIDLLSSYDKNGKFFWNKRNTIKIFKVAKEEWNVKSFKIPNFINQFAYKYIRKSKAQRSFEHAQQLLIRGINTPKPIAFVENYTLLGLGKSFYISENLRYDFTFKELFDENFPNRKHILNQFTKFTFELHEKGIHHFDHSMGNTLIVAKEKNQYAFYLIDLNRMVFEDMDYDMRIKNFDRLSLSSEMIEIISKKYAELVNKDVSQVNKYMTEVCKTFSTNRNRNKELKKKIGL